MPDPRDLSSRRAPVLQGELKQVTVLFTDLVSSTEMVAQLDAEEVMVRLRPALNTMCDAVERFGGIVFCTLGDGIMALFGAPRAQENHALMACQAALAITDAFKNNSLCIRIGLHSGEVVADAWMTDLTNEPGAYGLALHLASRLPAMAEPGAICISDGTYRLVSTFCDVARLGPHSLRGVPMPIELYLLKRLKPAVASEQFRGVTLTSFRGRNREMALLRDNLQAIETGGGRVISIVGEPGSGKSRLCFQFAEWCRGQKMLVFEARAQPYGASTPLQPILEFLRSSFFHILPDDEPQATVSTIAACLAGIGSDFEDDLPLVCDFLGVSYQESPPAWLDPKIRTARLLKIVRHLLCDHGTTKSIVIFEDLHWLDEMSGQFITNLADALPTTRTLLVVNYRPGFTATWTDRPFHHQIDLADLGVSDIVELVTELIGPQPELSEIRQHVAVRSGGNPFFAEELVRSLADNIMLVGQAGAFRRGITFNAAVLPPTVQAVIGARIDRLREADCNLLQLAAIIGKEFQFVVLQEVAGKPSNEVKTSIDRLCAAGLLHQRSNEEEGVHSFRHPLIQEVAYSSQLKARRSMLHAKVARAIERFYHDRKEEFAALLAYHFEEAGELRNAALHMARAARWLGLTSPAQAITHWHKVRALVAGQQKSAERNALGIEANSQIVWLGWREGVTLEQAHPYITEALQWAHETDDSMIQLLLFVEGRGTMSSGGAVDSYVRSVKQALSLTKPQRDTGRIATLNAALSQAFGWAGLLREGLEANDAALADIASVSDFDHRFLGYSVEYWAISLRGRLLLRLGHFEAARACFDHMLGINDWFDPTVKFMAHFGYIDLGCCINDAAMASEHAGQIARLAARDGSSSYLRFYATAGEGLALAVSRSYDRAVNTLSKGIQFLRDAGVGIEFETEMLATLADCQVGKGDHQAAIKVAREAILLARQRNNRLPESRASIILANALMVSEGNTACHEAAEWLDHAEALIGISRVRIYDHLLKKARELQTQVVNLCLVTEEKCKFS